MTSKKMSLDVEDFKKLGVNALLVGAAGSITYLIDNVASLDLGPSGALVVPIVVVVLDTVLKWLKDNTK